MKTSFYLSLLYIYMYIYFSVHERTFLLLGRVSYRGWNVVGRYQPMYLWGGICVAEDWIDIASKAGKFRETSSCLYAESE